MISGSHYQCQASLIRPITCPHCHAPLIPADVASTTLSDHVAHALIDHLLLIETELSAIRRLLVEEVIR